MVGANKPDAHLRGVVPGRDFQAEFADLHEANAGDGCGRCGAPLTVERVIEVGNIFKLGTKYSVPLRAVYLDEQGQERPIVMGSYGIGPARIAAAAIEQNHDKDGIIWPDTIAPLQIHLLVVNTKEPKMATLAEQLYADMNGAGLEVLYDDRDERPGVKFKDADLLGLPLRVTVGSRAVKEGVRGDPPAAHRGGDRGGARRGRDVRPEAPGSARVMGVRFRRGEFQSALWRWGPPVLWMAVISGFSTAAFSAAETGRLLAPLLAVAAPERRRLRPSTCCTAVLRKGMHVTEFGILALLWYRALAWGASGWRGRMAVAVFVLAAGFGALDEAHQMFVPSRTASIVDVGWDGLGAALGLRGRRMVRG